MKLKTKYKKHWENMGITDSEKLKEYITVIFMRHTNNHDVLIELNRMLFPDWAIIKRVNGFPLTGESLWKFIDSKFKEFDKRDYGGLISYWGRAGWNIDYEIDPWDVCFRECSLTFHTPKSLIKKKP